VSKESDQASYRGRFGWDEAALAVSMPHGQTQPSAPVWSVESPAVAASPVDAETTTTVVLDDRTVSLPALCFAAFVAAGVRLDDPKASPDGTTSVPRQRPWRPER